MVDLDRDERKIDIHHIFPRKWCEDMGIHRKVFNSIVNKTAISYKANRKIGGKAPSKYLAQLQEHPQVQLDDAGMDGVLRSHLIDPAMLRSDNFERFYAGRKAALLALVSASMGKALAPASELTQDEIEDEDDDEEDDEVQGEGQFES